MSLVRRIRRITTARVEAFLSGIEDPELLFPQLLKEMEEQVRAATEAEAKAMATVKLARRELDDARQRVERLGTGALHAMKQSDEATAREAVEAQIEAEKLVERRDQAVERAEAVHAQARDVRERTASQLDDLRARKDEILNRARLAKTQKSIEKTVQGKVVSTGSILDAVEKLERRVEADEAELEVRREMAGEGTAGASLETRLVKLETKAEVETRLAALKQRLSSTPES
jgi:phage shock protein A